MVNLILCAFHLNKKTTHRDTWARRPAAAPLPAGPHRLGPGRGPHTVRAEVLLSLGPSHAGRTAADSAHFASRTPGQGSGQETPTPEPQAQSWWAARDLPRPGPACWRKTSPWGGRNTPPLGGPHRSPHFAGVRKQKVVRWAVTPVVCANPKWSRRVLTGGKQGVRVGGAVWGKQRLGAE